MPKGRPKGRPTTRQGAAKLPDLPQARRLLAGGRSLKMLRPVCDRCDNTRLEWWKRCTHNPYVGFRKITREVPTYEDILKDEEPTGRKKLVGTETEVEFLPHPHFQEVPLTVRVDSGQAVEKARARGRIFPEELVSPEFPNGIAPCCQFRGCFNQDITVRSRYGDDCRELEGKFVAADERGKPRLEVGFNAQSQDKQREQLETVVL